MALTITIEGTGVIANASSTTESIGTGTNQWNESGSGIDSWSTDTYLQGGESFAGAYSNKSGFQYYHTSTSYDFDTSGTEEDQFIWIWVNCPTIGLIDTLANKGLAVRVGTDLTNYNDYTIAGSNDSNGWLGDWKCFVIDPTKTATATGGSGLTLNNVNYIGVWIDTTATAKGDNIFIDQIAIGTGLRIIGTSTTAWSDIVTYCNDYSSRAWGMIGEKEGIYFAQGKFYIGDTTLSANVSFADSGRIIQFIKSEYWTGSAWAESYPSTACGIELADESSGNTTTFSDGIVVGSDNGRSGTSFIGNSVFDVNIDFTGLTEAGSVVTCYGTTFKSLYGTLTTEADNDHKFYGCNWIDCSQFVPLGASGPVSPVIRNCTFAETADTDAALLWNDYIDIEDCNFIANTTGAAIEHASIESVYAGTCTNSGSETTTLHDSGGGFTANVDVGDYVYNETDSSYAQITTKVSDTELTHTALAGGTNDYWTNNDAYSISPAQDYDNLIFNGNTTDVDNNATGSDALFITKSNDSNPASTEGTIKLLGSVTITITVKDEGGSVLQNVQTAIYKTSDRIQLMNKDTSALGVATDSYTGSTPMEVEVRCRKASSGSTRYKNFSSIQTISSSGLDFAVTLLEDPNNNATS